MSRTLAVDPRQAALFDDLPSGLPKGFAFEADFIGADDEARLVELVAALPLQPAQYKGYTARRRVLSYGGSYDFDALELKAAGALPPALHPLRERFAGWLGVPASALAHALVAEYAPGTPLGWHRDVPDFELVAGVSLGGWARMRLRRYPPVKPMREAEVVDIDLPPRSAYILAGEARWGWQHCIAPTPALRWSITMRTLRSSR